MVALRGHKAFISILAGVNPTYLPPNVDKELFLSSKLGKHVAFKPDDICSYLICYIKFPFVCVVNIKASLIKLSL